eukprot:7771-Heterococcus_DN1.PRE.1
MLNNESLLSRSLSSLADKNNQPFRLNNAAKCMLTRSLSAKVIKAERARFKSDQQQADTLRRIQLRHRKSSQHLLPLAWSALAAAQFNTSGTKSQAMLCQEQMRSSAQTEYRSSISTARPSTAASSSRPMMQVSHYHHIHSLHDVQKFSFACIIPRIHLQQQQHREQLARPRTAGGSVASSRMSSAIAHDAEIAELLAELELAAAQSEADAVQQQHRHSTTTNHVHNSNHTAFNTMTPQLDSVPLLTVAAAAERTRRSTKKRTVSDQKQCATEMTGVHRRRQVAVLRKRQE